MIDALSVHCKFNSKASESRPRNLCLGNQYYAPVQDQLEHQLRRTCGNHTSGET